MPQPKKHAPMLTPDGLSLALSEARAQEQQSEGTALVTGYSADLPAATKSAGERKQPIPVCHLLETTQVEMQALLRRAQPEVWQERSGGNYGQTQVLETALSRR